MTTLISFAALFVSVIFVQMGSGALGPLDALSGAALGFSTTEIGVLGSAHYLGFFIGCWAAPRMMGTLGHSRAFAAMAAVGAIGALSHPIIVNPIAWAVMRVATGVAVAGAYTVIESWLHAKTENASRGRVYGVFRTVDLVGQLGAQGMIAVLEPAAFVSYNIVALFCCLCVLPLTLTRRVPPMGGGAPRLRPLKVLRLSPVAVASVIVAGLSGASFRMVGPIYGAEVGLSPQGVALFLAAAVIGGVAAQMPVGWVSDRFDRRGVLVALSLASIGVCLVAILGPSGGVALFGLSFLFGATAFPIYSVGASHANDFATADFVVELNAALMFFFGVGAIVSPVVSAELIALYGADALFAFIAVAHVFMALFGLWRMTRRAARPITPYVYRPRTSFTLARLSPRRNGKRNGAP
jgi:MFS family permease